MLELILMILSFLVIGSIPFSQLVVWAKGPKPKIDLRKFGSGNVGSSNAMRAMGARYGKKKALAWWLVMTLLDASKAFAAIALSFYLTHDLNILPMIGLCAVAGHCFPSYLGFRRGKGVSSTIGTLLALGLFSATSYYMELTFFLLALVTGLLVSKRASVASLLASIILLVWAIVESVTPLIGVAILIIVQHRQNIIRLIKGKELPVSNDVFVPTDT